MRGCRGYGGASPGWRVPVLALSVAAGARSSRRPRRTPTIAGSDEASGSRNRCRRSPAGRRQGSTPAPQGAGSHLLQGAYPASLDGNVVVAIQLVAARGGTMLRAPGSFDALPLIGRDKSFDRISFLRRSEFWYIASVRRGRGGTRGEVAAEPRYSLLGGPGRLSRRARTALILHPRHGHT